MMMVEVKKGGISGCRSFQRHGHGHDSVEEYEVRNDRVSRKGERGGGSGRAGCPHGRWRVGEGMWAGSTAESCRFGTADNSIASHCKNLSSYLKMMRKFNKIYPQSRSKRPLSIRTLANKRKRQRSAETGISPLKNKDRKYSWNCKRFIRLDTFSTARRQVERKYVILHNYIA